MAFSLGQFLGAPIIGDYADRHGRKKALLMTIACTFIGLILTAYSMSYYLLSVLFISRFITGVFASNGSVCLAAAGDLSQSTAHKTKNFGRFSVLAGVSFILGALVGGKLSDPTVSSLFFPELPIWIAAFFSACNFLFVALFFTETMKINTSKKLAPFSSLKNIKFALHETRLHTLYIIYFLFIASWTILLQFLPVLMIQRFSFTSSNLGDFALYVGVCWAFGSSQMKEFLLEYTSAKTLLKICLVIVSLLTLYVSFPLEIYTMLGIVGIGTVLGGIVWPLCTLRISSLASQNMQGKILSIGQSVQALGTTVAPLVGGVTFQVSFHEPFLLAGLMTGVSAFLYWNYERKSHRV